MPPVVDGRSRVIILGSMPGRGSLERRQYCARKQNAFWRIVHGMFDAVPGDGSMNGSSSFLTRASPVGRPSGMR